MARKIKELTDAEARGNLKPGYHSDRLTTGLWLAVGKPTKAGKVSKSWVFRYVPPNARAREAGSTAGRNIPRAMGLGSFPEVGVAAAREKAEAAAKLQAAGIDPLEERKREKSAVKVRIMTFAEAVSAYIEAMIDPKEKSNAKHKQQWRTTLETYANPIIGNTNVAHIDTDLVLKVLQQDVLDGAGNVVGTMWNTKTETASRVRGRIQNVLDWAKVAKYRSGENPAAWKGNLDKLLLKPTELKKVEHHAALPYVEIGAFMAELRGRDAPAARALEFAILTATRSNECRGAKWEEIDLKSRLWRIDGERMKAKKDHEVPLTDEMIALLEALPRVEGNAFVFIGDAKNGDMSENALLNVLDRMGRKGLTQHGFRSTFREWAGETTAHPREVIEHALSHQLKDKAEASYQRGSLLPKRRKLMADWSKYCAIVQPKDGENVVPMRAGASS